MTTNSLDSMRVWSQDRSIATPPVTTLRVDSINAPGTGAQKVLYEARMLDAYTIGVQTFVYGWPMVEASRIRSNMLDPQFSQHAPMNVYRHEPAPADDKYVLFPTPNGDLLYSEAFFDLTKVWRLMMPRTRTRNFRRSRRYGRRPVRRTYS